MSSTEFVQFTRVSDGTTIKSNNPALIQLKRDLAAKTLAEQQDAVRPGGAAPLSSAGLHPIQFAKPAKSAVTGITTSAVSKRPRDGLASGERAGGFTFGNREGRLPAQDSESNAITYTEYDVNVYDGNRRDAERVVVGSDGRMWYTGDHYASFEEIT